MNRPLATFMYKGDVVVVTENGDMYIYCMHPVTGEYIWNRIGEIRHPYNVGY